MTPAGTSNELDVQNEWEQNTHTHTHYRYFIYYCTLLHSSTAKYTNRTYTAVCVCVFSSHSFWTSSSLDVPAGVTQEAGHTGFLIHLLSPSGQSRVYRVTQLRTDGIHCQESTGTGPVNLKVVPNESAALAGHHEPINMCLSFSRPVNLKVVPNECCLGRSPWTN